MKIWILRRLIPDEHGELRIQFKAVYRTAEGAMRYVDEVFEKNVGRWQDVGYGYIKKSSVIRGYWEVSYSYMND